MYNPFGFYLSEILVSEDIFLLQFNHRTYLLQTFHIQFFLVTKNTISICTSLDPLVLVVDNILQRHVLHIIVQFDAAIHILSQVLSTDVIPDDIHLDGTVSTHAGNHTIFSKFESSF